MNLTPLEQQTIVITGATSGIGLTTAREAAERGARVVLVARNKDALDAEAQRLRDDGRDALSFACDVSDAEQVAALLQYVDGECGGFDTWVNNAGASIYGRLMDVPEADARKVFETNYWGVVHGSLAAARHVEVRRRPAALINVGSVLSDRAIPLQGHYCATKHAVKAFTDALRMELEEAGVPISVTLIKPAAINTPYPEHAKNHMDVGATLPSPAYAPEVVAEMILHAAEHPSRELMAGGWGGLPITLLGKFAPGVADAVMKAAFFGQQRDEDRRPDQIDGLTQTASRNEERGDFDGLVRESSLYNKVQKHPALTTAATVLAGVALGAGLLAVLDDDD